MNQKNETRPTIDLVVTRHPVLVEYLREAGLVGPDVPVIEHAVKADVEGKHVLGVLPHHLSSAAASVTEIPMRWSVADREAMQRGDLDLDSTRKAASDPVTYVVTGIDGGGTDRRRPRWLAVARAYEHVERYGYHFDAGPVSIPRYTRRWRGLHVTFVGDGSTSISADVIEARGVWRPGGRGPWLDGYGREVDPASIAPAAGWEPTSPDWDDAEG